MGELDCYGSFVDFAGTALLWQVLRILLYQVRRHHLEALQ
jgi:hypothetical protein